MSRMKCSQDAALSSVFSRLANIHVYGLMRVILFVNKLPSTSHSSCLQLLHGLLVSRL